MANETLSTTIWVSAAHASAFVAALVLAVGPIGPALAQDPAKTEGTAPAGGLGGLGQVAEQQTSPEQGRFDAAQRLFAEEQYAAAAVAFHELSVDEAAAPLKDASEYNLGKALYRLKLNHSAIAAFEKILARGPSGKYYRSSQEWSLFIARKIAGDDRVLATVAKYGDGKFPEDHKNEFRFELARYHYARALAVESGAEIGALGEARAEETVTGGLSLKGDVFSEDDAGGEEPGGAKDPEGEVKEKEGGGLSIGGDIFGGDEAEPAPTPKKDAKKADKKKKSKKKKGKKKKGLFDEDPAEEEAPVAEPKAEAPPPPPKPVEPAPAPADAKADPAKKKEATSADGFTVKEHMEAATKYLQQVDASSDFSAKAKFLEGVLMYRDKRDNDALEAFKSVVRLTKSGSAQEDKYLRQLAFFQLARAHFGAKQPSFSIYYYGKIRRLTYEWLDALYEGSWAEFRLGNYEKALGNLLTLHSPFFRDQYFPESLILKAVVYYENCRYPEAKAILTDFQKRYEPVYEELKSLTARTQQADKYYEVLANLRGAEVAPGADKAEILSQILGIALSDAELQRLDESAREVDAELAAFDGAGPVFAQSRLRSQLAEQLGAVRADYQKEAGRAVKRKLEGEREAIKTLIQQAIRIDIETARAEQERIESTLRDVQSAPKDLEREFVEWTDDEKLVWPFADEYWRDELGTYEVALGHSCR